MIAATSLLDRLGKRAGTMARALDLLTERDGAVIVETGCARSEDGWAGDGMSTLVFADYCATHGTHLTTIDNDPVNLELARMLAGSTNVSYVLGDSVEQLARLASIDLLYLDSTDYPYGALLDIYGGRTDIDRAIVTLAKVPEAQIVHDFGYLIAASQEHAADEVRAALPALHDRSLVLIDDAGLPGGGKARLARRVLAEAGYVNLMDGYQTLWGRP